MNCGSRFPQFQGSQSGFNQFNQPFQQSDQYSQPQPQQEPQPQQQTPPQSGENREVAYYVAHMQTGKHKHMFTDIGFEDASGNQVFVAQKHSLLGFEYNVLDAYGNVLGYVKQEKLSIHNAFDALDAQRSLVGRVKHQLMGSIVFEHNFWVEDSAGHKIMNVTGDAFSSQFTMTSASTNSVVAVVKLALGGGLLQRLGSLQLGRYEIHVYGDVSQLLLATFVVGVEHLRKAG
jgi:uncharacterized protein YxjI